MISIIVAIAQNGVIGNCNKLIWHIPEDLKKFKNLTMGHPVIMGRKTFESIGKPLPGRKNIIITRNKEYTQEGCIISDSLDKAVRLFPSEDEIFIIGGGEIYRQGLPLADKLYITEVTEAFDGDTFFPEINPNEWVEKSCEYGNDNNNSGLKYIFKVYTRKT